MSDICLHIAKELGDYISDRDNASRLFEKLLNSKQHTKYVFDFSGVRFVSRSFMDEFYNKFLSHESTFSDKVEIVNLSDNFVLMLESVKKTQTRRQCSVFSQSVPTKSFSSIKDLNAFLGTLSL